MAKRRCRVISLKPLLYLANDMKDGTNAMSAVWNEPEHKLLILAVVWVLVPPDLALRVRCAIQRCAVQVSAWEHP